ncbi:hypothetical protein PVL29_002918 [Vitis rotundifolia]|uniref:Uncharacterized protein n=1 Tax=Vitis rotundifolia TaxID=103349 RepID=A0AA39ACL9_VITRO|nr:hypothetical protein PVL29_002918 [Vitis rotundifolia]
MISAKKLIKMTRKWQKLAAIRRKRISLVGKWMQKGHFVVYSANESRFVVPLPYLNSSIFRELFKMSEEEFGLPSNCPITLPCDAVFIEYIISLVQQSIAKYLEKALLTAIATGRCLSTSNLCQEQGNQQLLMAALGRKRISLQRINKESCTTSVANKGHFVVCTADQRRFMIPLVYLSNNIFRELFKMSEFELPSNGPITLPCDSVFMEYRIPLIQRGMAKVIEKALLFSIVTSRCSLSSSHQGHMGHQLLLCGY